MEEEEDAEEGDEAASFTAGGPWRPIASTRLGGGGSSMPPGGAEDGMGGAAPPSIPGCGGSIPGPAVG